MAQIKLLPPVARRRAWMRLAATLALLVFCGGAVHAQFLDDVTIHMSDGVDLEGTIIRPLRFPPSGGFPSIILVHGFGGNKDDMRTIGLSMAAYGYASLAYSVRGQGNSGGLSTIDGPRERQDLVEVIQYFRNAYWINPNKLGVTGGSQGGIHAWIAAAYQMPGVMAVAPLIATPDFARALIPNDCVTFGLVRELVLGSVRYSTDRDRMRNFIIGDQWDSIHAYIEERDIADLVGNVEIPVMQALGWADYLFPVNGGIKARANLSSRGKSSWSYYGTNGHGELDPPEAAFVLAKLVEWFDHWLKGFTMVEDSTVVYADDRPAWPHHTTPVWPPQPYSDFRYYLTAQGLSKTPPGVTAEFPFSQVYDSTYTPAQAWDDRYGRSAFVNAFSTSTSRLVSPPLDNTVEVTGIPTGRISVESEAQKFQAHVRYFDVQWADTGYVWTLMSRSINGISNVPGSTHVIDLEARALSHIIPAGHRIGIEVTSLDMLSDNQANVVPYFLTSHSRVLSSFSEPSYVDIPVVGDVPTNAGQTTSNIPESITLYQNYPNPFNPSTTISFDIPSSGRVTLKIHDVLGREVETLVNEDLNPGSYVRAFDGSSLASGVYFCRLQANEFHQTKKLVLQR